MNFIIKIAKYIFLSAVIFAVVLSGKFTGLMNGPGLAYIFLGTIAMVLMSFSWPEIKTAFKHASGRPGEIRYLRKSMYFWEAIARNAWILGVLGAIINFIIALSVNSGGIKEISFRMSRSFLTAVYGMILGVIFFVPALKLKQELGSMSSKDYSDHSELPQKNNNSFFRFEHLFGYVLFLAVVVWSILAPLSNNPLGGPLNPIELFLYWPSMLVVLGGTTVLVLFVGKAATGQPFTLGFALTGLVSSLTGFVQVLLAFSLGGVRDIAVAVTLIVSSCFMVLLGMILVGNPLEDRAVKTLQEVKPSPLSRIAWYVFPLLTLIFLVMTFIVVITPMKKVG